MRMTCPTDERLVGLYTAAMVDGIESAAFAKSKNGRRWMWRFSVVHGFSKNTTWRTEHEAREVLARLELRRLERGTAVATGVSRRQGRL